MIEWKDPEILWWLLLLIPLGIIIGFVLCKKQKVIQHIWKDPVMAQSLFRLRLIMALLYLSAIACILLAWANPRKGDSPIEKEVDQMDIVLAIDISRSMLTTDIQPNRLSIAKNLSLELIKALPTERIGSLVFAGNAYVNMPLTTDIQSLPTFINNISVQSAGTQGTAIGEAIELSMKNFHPEDPSGLQLIILSDGEDHEADVIEMAEEAAGKGINIHTIGIGTPKGGRIPIQVNGRKQYLRDKDNQEVVSQLEEGLLRKVAAESGGIYTRYTTMNQTANDIVEHLNSLDQSTKRNAQYMSYRYYYKYLIGLGFIFLISALFIQWRYI